MPTPDHAPRRTSEERLRIAQERAGILRLVDRIRRGKKGGGGQAGEGVPFNPLRPGSLDGGAAAALAFDD